MKSLLRNFLAFSTLGIFFIVCASRNDEVTLKKKLLEQFKEAVNTGQFKGAFKKILDRKYEPLYLECENIEMKTADEAERLKHLNALLDIVTAPMIGKNPYLPPELVDCIQNAKENPTTQDKPSDLAERAVTLAREFIDKEYFRGFLLYVRTAFLPKSKNREDFDSLLEIFYKTTGPADPRLQAKIDEYKKHHQEREPSPQEIPDLVVEILAEEFPFSETKGGFIISFSE